MTIRPVAGDIEATAPARDTFFVALEALRGICALFVVFYHFPWHGAVFRLAALHQSWLFVDLFFVLSGFVICHVYLARLGQPSELRRFAEKRFFRLYPLHLFAWLCSSGLIVGRYALGLGPRPPSFNWTNNLLGLTLTHGLGFTEDLPINSSSWSVSTEMAAYVLFAAICLLTTRRRIFALGLASLVALIVLVAFNGATIEGGMAIRVVRCIYSFGLGALAWRFARPAPWLQWVSLVAVAALLWLAGIETRLTLLFPVAAACLVAALSFDGGLARFLSHRPFVAIGRWSFSIYLMHSAVLTVAGFAINRLVTARDGTIPVLAPGPAVVIELAATALVILVSALTYRFVEQPGRMLGRRLAARRDSPPT